MKIFDEFGQIINPNNPPQNNFQSIPSPSAYYDPESRKTFVTATMIISPIIYGILALVLNEAMQFYLEPVLAALIGAGVGLLGTGIYNFRFREEADGEPKDYLFSLLMPLGVAAILSVGIFIIVIVISFFILAAVLGGG
jgi:hypothetical protein